MTKAEAAERFAESQLSLFVEPGARGAEISDDVALAEAWNDYTDMLCKDGEITDRQYRTWTHPRFSRAQLAEALYQRRSAVEHRRRYYDPHF